MSDKKVRKPESPTREFEIDEVQTSPSLCTRPVLSSGSHMTVKHSHARHARSTLPSNYHRDVLAEDTTAKPRYYVVVIIMPSGFAVVRPRGDPEHVAEARPPAHAEPICNAEFIQHSIENMMLPLDIITAKQREKTYAMAVALLDLSVSTTAALRTAFPLSCVPSDGLEEPARRVG